MNRYCAILSVATFAAIPSVLSCQGTPSEQARQIDDLMTYCHEHDLFNGTVLVASRGVVVYANALGYADFDANDTLRLESAFDLGSIAKTFTSMAVMILKERGALSYDDRLSDHLPEHPSWADRVTIRHLLTHTAGVPDWSQYPGFRSSPGNFIDDLTNNDVLRFLVAQDSLEFPPGEQYDYSNSGYTLLALVVEAVSGDPFHLFMKENVFDPLGMENTVIPHLPRQRFPGRTIGHNSLGQRDDNNILISGAGGLYSTVGDLLKWDRALYGEQLVSQETLQEAFTPIILNDGTRYANQYGYSYGFGWVLEGENYDQAVFHDGGFNGFSAMFYRELEGENLIVFLTNKGSSFQVYPTLEAVLNILHGRPYAVPTPGGD